MLPPLTAKDRENMMRYATQNGYTIITNDDEYIVCYAPHEIMARCMTWDSAVRVAFGLAHIAAAQTINPRVVTHATTGKLL